MRVLLGGAWGFACDRRLTDEGARDAALRACTFARAAAGEHARASRPSTRRRGPQEPVERIPSQSRSGKRSTSACVPMRPSRTGHRRPPGDGPRPARTQSARLDGGNRRRADLTEAAGARLRRRERRQVPATQLPQRHMARAPVRLGVRGGARLVRRGAARREQAAALLRADVCPSGITTIVLDGTRSRCRYTSRSATRPSSTASTGRRRRTRARASSIRATSARSVRLRAHEHHRRPDDGRRPRQLRVRRRGSPGGAASRSSRPAGSPASSLRARRRRAWARQRRLDARRQLEPDAARADDESPHRAGRGNLEDLLADVDDGIYMETNRSWSIDDKRLNFQFGTQVAWEIKNGKLGRMLRDATYTGITPEFWGSLDAVAGPRALAAVRDDELRQGPAGPERARLARRGSRAFPQRPGRRQSMSALEIARAAVEAAAARPRRSPTPSAPGSCASPTPRSTSRR